MRRGSFRRLGSAFGVLTLLLGSLLALSSSVALAAPLTINVPCSTDSLVSAINSANANADGGTLTLAPHCTYTITTPATAADGLPVITGNVTIKGQAATITRDETAGRFRIFDVVSGGTLNIDFLTISNGNTTGLGGAIQLAGTATVSNSTLTGNTAGNGGAIAANASANLTVTTTTFHDNTATSVGGGGMIVFGIAHVTRSTIDGSTAPINGGGINVQPSGQLTLTNSTLVNNTSSSLGGALSNLGTTTVTNVTFSGNTGSDGDAIATGNNNVTIANSIIDDETDHNECSPSGTISSSYNLASDDSCVTSATSHTISPSHPLSLGPLQFNGGQTQTMLPSANSTGVIDQIPLANCVAADASTPGQMTAVTVDQVGISRPQGSRCDIGAVEFAKDLAVYPALTTAVYDAQRHNISSRGLTVTAYNIAPLDEPWDGTNGNMQRQFTYNSRLPGGGGYQLTFMPLKLPRGTYALSYEIEGDPAVYIIEFRVL